ncbi:MAG: SPOR domain-containing protein [Candidatus Aminicenantia bacterium]
MDKRSDREIVLTSSQLLIIFLLLIILMGTIFILGISVGRKQKQVSKTQVEEKFPPVVVKEEEPEEKIKEGYSPIEEKPSKEIPITSKLYFIQIGAFSSEASASNFANKFREKGYAVKVIPPTPQDKNTLYRVRVGPYLNMGDAKTVLGKLKEMGKENYWIVVEEGR